jgi:hypothetical protein
MCLKGLECSKLGNESGVKTVVHIRTHYRQEKAKTLADSVLVEAPDILSKAKKWSKMGTLDEEQEQALLQASGDVGTLIGKRKMFDARVAKFDKMVQDQLAAGAKIFGTLYADTVVASPFSTYMSNAPIPGPLTVNESNSSKTMAVVRG